MPHCLKSIYSCSLICFNATLQNEDTFVCDMIEAQWMHWSDLYFDKLCLIYFTKDWIKFYFKSLFTLARILNILGDQLELLPSVLLSFCWQGVKFNYHVMILIVYYMWHEILGIFPSVTVIYVSERVWRYGAFRNAHFKKKGGRGRSGI